MRQSRKLFFLREKTQSTMSMRTHLKSFRKKFWSGTPIYTLIVFLKIITILTNEYRWELRRAELPVPVLYGSASINHLTNQSLLIRALCRATAFGRRLR